MDKPSPEWTASFPNRLFFSWVDVMIIKGWKKPLTAEDMYDLNPNDGCRALNPVWERHWQRQEKKKFGLKPLSILPTLVVTFGLRYLQASCVQLVTILLNQVLRYFITCTPLKK